MLIFRRFLALLLAFSLSLSHKSVKLEEAVVYLRQRA